MCAFVNDRFSSRESHNMRTSQAPLCQESISARNAVRPPRYAASKKNWGVGFTMFNTELPLNVHWIAIECSMNCHWTAIECSLNCHWTAIELPLNDHWITIECSLNVHWTAIELPLNVRWIAIELALNCHSICKREQTRGNKRHTVHYGYENGGRGVLCRRLCKIVHDEIAVTDIQISRFFFYLGMTLVSCVCWNQQD